jgi:hypothetical protein
MDQCRLAACRAPHIKTSKKKINKSKRLLHNFSLALLLPEKCNALNKEP